LAPKAPVSGRALDDRRPQIGGRVALKGSARP
jgi:hypothetical protein